jgi:hypothetical protein
VTGFLAALGVALVGIHSDSPAEAVVTPRTQVGVYAAPASRGITGAAAFDNAVGQTSTEALDFGSTSDWRDLTGPSWLLSPHSAQPATLEYSLPMMPAGPGYTLAQCANGGYDAQWLTLGRNLVAAKLPNTLVRPGWEFNGNWYAWSAAGRPAQYVGCFRHIVTTMRRVTGQHFTFDWNVNVNSTASFNPTSAYPGDAYVDYVGVDTYDTYWTGYNSPQPTATQQASAWNYLSRGGYGLNFWSAFAQAHRKQLALPEWGVSRLPNNKGGGDDPDFIDKMFAFMADRSHNVAYMHYFNTGYHVLTDGTFPKSLARYRVDVKALVAPS